MPQPLLNALEARLSELRPDLVVECGSGATTPVLGRVAGHVLSLEHDAYWHGQTASLGLPDNVELIYAPLVGTPTPMGLLPFYDHPLPDEIDFALIDGPPGNIGRLGAGFMLIPRAKEVWLDDADRTAEQVALQVWACFYDFTVEMIGRVAVIARQ